MTKHLVLAGARTYVMGRPQVGEHGTASGELVDDLREGTEVQSTRGPRIVTWREAERVLAGFPDGLADDGPAAGPAALYGTSGSRVCGSLTSSRAQKYPSPRTSPTLGCFSAISARRGAMTVSDTLRTFSRMPSSSKIRIDATAEAQASGWPE